MSLSTLRHLRPRLNSPRNNIIGRSMASRARPLSKPLPAGTWDSHMHIVEPNRFPLSAEAKYTPPAHKLEDAKHFYDSLGIKNLVVVQPSIYGTDNSCTLEALRQLTPAHGRAVVQFDPETIDPATLQEWHAMGVRGVRVNIVSIGRAVVEAELRDELSRYADVIRPLGWVLQVFVPLDVVPALVRIVPSLQVKFCIDHFGYPSLPDPYDPNRGMKPYDIPAFASLVNLLHMDNVFIKLSAPYRISKDAEMRDLDLIGRELIKQAPNRVVYATDWPHTRFENIDSVPFIERCYSWCGEGTGLVDKLFRTNAETLWDVPQA